jgi:type IV secretion system protein VirB5
MKKQARGMALVAAVVVGLAAPTAHATYPVIDVAAITQLLQQVNYWKQQITAMSNQLNQLRQTHSALTGSRGMQNLLGLSDAQRNYLPKGWNGVAQVLQGQSAQYGQLAGSVASLVKANAVLTPAELAQFTPDEQGSIVAARQAAAGRAVLAQAAFQQASARFSSLAQLIQAIGSASDAKAILDLQGRIEAEQAMLANEQTKLEVLAQAAEADRWVREQQLRELALAGHGDFASRLHPVP